MTNLSPQQFPVERLMQAYSTEYEGPVHAVAKHLDQTRLKSYTARNTEPPPVHLTEGEGEDILVNGHHRVVAAARAGRKTLSGYLHPLVDGDHPTLQPEHLR